MDLGLSGRVAIVGGGSKGLGKACALSLAREGAKVAICSRSANDLEAAAQEIRAETGSDVLVVPGDLSTLSGVQDFIQTTVDHFGRLDVVVSNSGGPPEGRAVDTNEETWERSIQMALTFFIRMGRESVPYLREHSWGRIVNILASTVYQPIDNLANFRGHPDGSGGLRQEPGRRGGTGRHPGEQRRPRLPVDRPHGRPVRDPRQ